MRTLAGRGIDEQPAAQLLHLGGDHIHSNPAARGLRDMTGGAEARQFRTRF